jgi:hypothetical protein
VVEIEIVVRLSEVEVETETLVVVLVVDTAVNVLKVTDLKAEHLVKDLSVLN